MKKTPSFNAYIEKSIKNHWNLNALTDYKGKTLQYQDVARKIEKLHILFENGGIAKGDKIALCARNSSHWAVAYFAILTYGAVVVPVQSEFTPEQIYNIVNHSESKLLFVGDTIAANITIETMPIVEAIVYLPDFSLRACKSEKLTFAREHLNELFGKKYPKYFRKEHVAYHLDESKELAIINYTSGTTGFSKGVMLPYRALWGNLDFMMHDLAPHVPAGSNILSILPMAHMYGQMFELVLSFCVGAHNYILTRQPSPSLIIEALAEVKPAIVSSVPLTIDKIIRKRIFPQVQNSRIKLLSSMPVIGKKVKNSLCQMVRDLLGGNIYEVIVGGASLNKEIEDFLTDIGFPITVVYGATEAAPVITFTDKSQFASGSCGLPLSHLEVKIDSTDPQNVPGEIVARGINIMQGYYKNEEATRQVLDEEGWYHTGDLATMAADGHIYIRGRIKNMLLGSNGQNVFPEEIEDKLNSMSLVNESLVVQKGDKLVGLVFPDQDEVASLDLSTEELEGIMEQNRRDLNALLPSYCHLSAIKLHDSEFEKTPKKSIKRFLYQNV
ncbi:AMP-binding protein [Hoylesella shahii]|uniref:Long-chain acyl-CoA synthetase n=1 Tax=Hoylesella shahii DSM 15611 = JCM 12083 TaxID=1122991 RepID=A0A318HT54_9BACT|nr:AMP-binding protein [Hoylesella shahii]PXX21442.1 long-chain acyl-CoA synthetase [Hoylesella shahii DSM 15611 = JCM 12083]